MYEVVLALLKWFYSRMKSDTFARDLLQIMYCTKTCTMSLNLDH